MIRNALIIDDSNVSQILAKTFLERDGWQVTLCNTAEQALPLLAKLQPHLLLCDISLPGMSGVDFMHAIKTLAERPAHCIAYTAHSMAHELKSIQDAGFDTVLSKPINPVELQQLLEAINHE